MGQKQGREQTCLSNGNNFNGMASPVFALDKVRGAKGGFSVTSRYHVNRALRQDYKVERQILGSGASGPVHLAKRGNRQFAVKSFRKRGLSAEAKLELRGEVEVYLKLDHPHVARLEDVYETERELHLVMELMSGGELYARLAQRRHYSEADAAHTCRQMLLAVAYLHAHNIVHRDLKLENFLYERQDTEHLKLIDFGFAKYHERGSTKMSRSCGSLHYIAPEVLKHSYDEKADMWSLGVIVYMLLTGNPPFYGSTDEKCLYRIQRGEPSFSKRWFKLSGGAQTFVLSLLALDPEQRPGAADALKRPWICMLETPKAKIDCEVLSSLRSFAQASHFRRACLSMMAWSLTLEDQAELRVQFQLLDTNQSGTITQHELASVLQANFNIDNAETATLFHGLDTKGSKEISYAEFLAATMKKRMRMHEDVLHATFERFDVEGKGEITPSNLRALLGDSFEGSDVEELIREADCDGDGRVSYADFLAYLQDDDGQAVAPMASETSGVEQEVCSPSTELSRRLRATREFTEIIDVTLPAKALEDNSRSRALAGALTPKIRKPATPVKQWRFCGNSSAGPEASNAVSVADAADALSASASATPKKPFNSNSQTSVPTPPLAEADLDNDAGILQPAPGSTTATASGSVPGSSMSLAAPELFEEAIPPQGESNRSSGERSPFRGPAPDEKESSPFVPPDPSIANNDSRRRWQQCFSPKWPFWRRTSEEGARRV